MTTTAEIALYLDILAQLDADEVEEELGIAADEVEEEEEPRIDLMLAMMAEQAAAEQA